MLVAVGSVSRVVLVVAEHGFKHALKVIVVVTVVVVVALIVVVIVLFLHHLHEEHDLVVLHVISTCQQSVDKSKFNQHY